MKHYLLSVFLVILSLSINATDKDSTIYYNLPDSVKAVQFMAEINVQAITSKKEVFAGIKTDAVKLSLESDKMKKKLYLNFLQQLR